MLAQISENFLFIMVVTTMIQIKKSLFNSAWNMCGHQLVIDLACGK